MLQEAKAAARRSEPALVPIHAPKQAPEFIICYENEIPPFAAAEMNRLYGSPYPSVAHLRAAGRLDQASTYVLRKGAEIVTVLLFRIDRRRVEVLNEVIRIEQEDITCFAEYIFATFPSIQAISFRAIQLNFRELPFSFQRFDYLEDFVVTLPASANDYAASLGKKTRSNMRRYLKLLKRDFASFRFELFENEQVQRQHVSAIMALYRDRMSAKYRVLETDEREVDRLFNLVRENGSVGVVTIDGAVCAGAITSRVGPNIFLRVLAHDLVYNRYSLGTLCCYLTISESILRGAREFHLLWGESDYKYLLSGARRDLDFLAVYRSRTQLLLNIDIAIKACVREFVRTALRHWHDAKRQDTLATRLAVRVLNSARSLKRIKLLLIAWFYSGLFDEILDQWAIIL